jgi:cytochrome c oxidase assembly protein subunit 15
MHPEKLKQQTEKSVQRFIHWSGITLLLVLLLIVAGGVVRSTGSGMGCPDWPKCFGQWIPPLSETELPPDYRTRFDTHRHGVAPFSAFKTWIEYLNRLLGVVIGFAVFILLILGLPLRKKKPELFVIGIFAFVLTGLNGWLGSKVVATNLREWVVTLHMLLAVLLVFVLMRAWISESVISVNRATAINPGIKTYLFNWASILLVLFLIQIILGTRVREMIDAAEKSMGSEKRAEWLWQNPIYFYFHRSYSLLLAALTIYFYLQLRKYRAPGLLHRFTIGLIGCIGFSIVLGIGLAYAGLPASLQPLHLITGVLLILLSFGLWLSLYPTPKNAPLSVPEPENTAEPMYQ